MHALTTRDTISRDPLKLPSWDQQGMAKGENGAGPSKPSIVDKTSQNKKRKLESIKKSKANPSTSSTGSTSAEPTKSKAEKNKEKFKEWRDRKRQKTRSAQHAEAVSSLPPTPPLPAPTREPDDLENDMATEILFTTMTGKLVTTQNLGIVLTRYLQAFHGDPAKFCAQTEFTLIPPANSADSKWKPDPKHIHQPPPDSLYQCNISLPSELKFKGVTSSPPGFRSKALAKRDAMATMVKALMEAGEIDEDLDPRPTGAGAKAIAAKDRKDLAWFEKQEKLGKIGTEPATGTTETLNQRWAAFKSGIRDKLPPLPQTADGRKSILDVVPISSPQFWQECPPFTDSAELYPTLVSMTVEGSTDECRTMCLLTTRPIPETESGLQVDLSVRKIEQPAVVAAGVLQGRPALKISADRVEAAFQYTRIILDAHLARPVTSALAQCRWLLLPLQRGYQPTKHPMLKRKHIDWEQVEAAERSTTTPFAIQELPNMSKADIEDSIFGTADSSRLVHLQPTRTGADTTADSTDQCKSSIADGTLVEAIVALPGRKGGYVNQLSSSRDVLPNLRDIRIRRPIPASVYRTTSMIPEFMNQLDSTLIARQLSEKLFDRAIDTSLALKSITPRKTSGDLLHSYERLEFLGDTLLKLVGTIDVFARPSDGRLEVEVEKDRHMMLSNRMLQLCADKTGISPYIRNIRFKASSWMPAGWTFKGETKATESSQTLGLKVVADVAEALIAAAYLSQSRSLDSAITAVRTLNIPLQAVHRWSDTAIATERYIEQKSAEPPTEESSWMGALTKPSLKVFGYRFRHPQKGQLVLTQTPDPGNREAGVRYKLLGNAILEYFVIEGIWDKYPDAGPPAMTVMKHSRVGDMNLSALCAVSPVFDQLVDIPPHLLPAYRKYRKLALTAKSKADKEIAAASGAPDWDRTQQLSDVGKEWWSDIGHTHLLGNVIEGLLGAILEDSGYDLDICREIYTTHILPNSDKYCVGPHEESQHPKDWLHKTMSMRKCQHFEIRRADLNDKSGEYEATVRLHDEDVGRGSAPWQELAVRRACAQVVQTIKEDKSWLDTEDGG